MKGTLSNVLIFTVGAAIGSAVTWKILKTKYEQLMQEEIESVKESLSLLTDENGEDTSETTEPERESVRVPAKPDLREYKAKVAQYRSEIESNDDPDDEPVPIVYVINPDVFGEDDYETEFLTLYADDVLADDSDNPVSDVVGRVGRDFYNHFGTYEEDTVCVRNEELHTDFEISRDDRRYKDLYSTPNHHKGDTE